MHAAIIDYLNVMSRKHPAVFNAKKVLEAGSMDINGSPRKHFGIEKFDKDREYVGIDWREGRGVDVVSLIHEYRGKPDGYFDTIISTSTIEHDPYWKESLQRMTEVLAMDGSMILTFPTVGWGKHCEESSPVEGHYKNILLTDVLYGVLKHCWFETTVIEFRPGNNFIFFHKKRRREFYKE